MICLDPGEQENIDKFTRRLVKVTKHHNDECKKLLTLMGVPYVEVRSTLTFTGFVSKETFPISLVKYIPS